MAFVFTVLFMAIVLIVGFYMAWTIGANDVANSMGTSVGSGALTLKEMILVAAIFEFAGAVVIGAHVTDTVRKGIIDPMAFENNVEIFAYGMMAALLAAALWITLATYWGLPISTSHSIVGGVFGFGISSYLLGEIGLSAIKFDVLTNIALSWVISPIMGALLAFLMFYVIRKTILDRDDPERAAKKMAPILLFVVIIIIVIAVLIKAPSGSIAEGLSLKWIILTGLILGSVSCAIGYFLLFSHGRRYEKKSYKRFGPVEYIFVYLQIVSACAVAFAHGSNDVANSIGPVAAIYSVFKYEAIRATTIVPKWLLVLGGVGLVIGLATWGYKVVRTIGEKISEITPTRGFSAEFGTAITVLACSLFKMPISTSQVLVGAVIGVGLARGVGAIDLRVIKKIIISWVATIPIAALTTAAIFLIMIKFL